MGVLLLGVLFAAPGCLLSPGCKGGSSDRRPMTENTPSSPPSSPLAPGAASGEASPGDDVEPADVVEARRRLVRGIEAQGPPWSGGDRWDARVLDTLRAVPRHRFMPAGTSIPDAYADRPHPIGHGQTISQPTVVAIMTQALELDGSERVLEIGTGSGYQAAVLARLARKVFSIEIVAPLGEEARRRLAAMGHDNVEVRIGDGYQGWPEHAPFDCIILTAAPPEMPEALIRQLAEGGIVVAPVGDDQQRLVRWTKTSGELVKEDLGSVRFVPMVPK